jgi:phytoene dehydrogenase-like protein
LFNALFKIKKKLGGEIKINAEVEEITEEDSKVTSIKFKNGEVHNIDLVNSNENFWHTYENPGLGDVSSFTLL